MKQMGKQQGFTLVELLVVIGIIMVLMAILYPVFQTVREKARQTSCISNLHQVSTAIKSYRTDHGRYPWYPWYNATESRYEGGVSALAPDYITDRKLLICPDDRQVDGNEETAQDNGYSSYNGWVADPATSWDFEAVTDKSPEDDSDVTGEKRTYNFKGYSQEGWDLWSGTANVVPFLNTLPPYLRDNKLSYRHRPYLENRTAPDLTFITHCVHHREQYRNDNDKIDIVITVGGSAKTVNVSQMSAYDPAASGAKKYSKWVTQKD